MNSEEIFCPICFEIITENTKCTILHCQHKFCKDCIFSNIMTSVLSDIVPKCSLDNQPMQFIEHFKCPQSKVTFSITDIVKELFLKWYLKLRIRLFESLNDVLFLFHKLRDYNNNFNSDLELFEYLLEQKAKKEIIGFKPIFEIKYSGMFKHIDQDLQTKLSPMSGSLKTDKHVLSSFKHFFITLNKDKENDYILQKIYDNEILLMQFEDYYSLLLFIYHNFINIMNQFGKIDKNESIKVIVIQKFKSCCKYFKEGFKIFAEKITNTKTIMTQNNGGNEIILKDVVGLKDIGVIKDLSRNCHESYLQDFKNYIEHYLFLINIDLYKYLSQELIFLTRFIKNVMDSIAQDKTFLENKILSLIDHSEDLSLYLRYLRMMVSHKVSTSKQTLSRSSLDHHDLIKEYRKSSEIISDLFMNQILNFIYVVEKTILVFQDYFQIVKNDYINQEKYFNELLQNISYYWNELTFFLEICLESLESIHHADFHDSKIFLKTCIEEFVAKLATLNSLLI